VPPLPFVWPYWVLFWAVYVWAFAPEWRVIREARKGAAREGSADAGSIRVIVWGTSLALTLAFVLAWIPSLRLPAAWQGGAFAFGTATLLAGSLLRRHCWRVLGAWFTGDVRAHPEQAIVTSGAYAWVRHPSYSAGILMNSGIGLALGSWASVLLVLLVSCAVYAYRIAIEERVLLGALGEPYREFMRTRKRLVPFIY
jgi:protein-S-isoprenylcysteine O-methyltransferase Ste14